MYTTRISYSKKWWCCRTVKLVNSDVSRKGIHLMNVWAAPAFLSYFSSNAVVDVTGSSDIFYAGFLLKVEHFWGMVWALCVNNRWKLNLRVEICIRGRVVVENWRTETRFEQWKKGSRWLSLIQRRVRAKAEWNRNERARWEEMRKIKAREREDRIRHRELRLI